MRRPLAFPAVAIILMLSACGSVPGEKQAVDEPFTSSKEEPSVDVGSKDPDAEEQYRQKWTPTTMEVDSLASSCGLTPQSSGSIVSSTSVDSSGFASGSLKMVVTDGMSLSLADLACVLEASDSGKILGDFPAGGPFAQPEQAYTWTDSRGVWRVFGVVGIEGPVSTLRIDFSGY